MIAEDLIVLHWLKVGLVALRAFLFIILSPFLPRWNLPLQFLLYLLGRMTLLSFWVGDVSPMDWSVLFGPASVTEDVLRRC